MEIFSEKNTHLHKDKAQIVIQKVIQKFSLQGIVTGIDNFKIQNDGK